MRSLALSIPAPLPEPLVQANLCPQTLGHTPPDALAVFSEGCQHGVSFLLNNLNLANSGQIDPFTASNVVSKHLEIAFNGFPDKRFGEITPLAGNMGNALGVVHLGSFSISGDKRDMVTT